jgi:Na+/melibiose symporter-like transporter
VTLIRKLSSALAIFAVSNAIGWSGYVQPLEEIVDGATKLVEQPQTEQFVLVLRLIFALLPVLLLTLSVLFARRYPLSPQVHERLNTVLAARRAGEVEGQAERAEAEELERLLVG